jgi:hypothetical protein
MSASSSIAPASTEARRLAYEASLGINNQSFAPLGDHQANEMNGRMVAMVKRFNLTILDCRTGYNGGHELTAQLPSGKVVALKYHGMPVLSWDGTDEAREEAMAITGCNPNCVIENNYVQRRYFCRCGKWN